MRKLTCLLFLATCLFSAACDLNPRIAALPDSIGEFISARYPAMLADPDTQPEIYNSAASDYGVYTSPDIYGSDALDEYTLYASSDDYVMPAQTSAAPPIYGTQVEVKTTAPGVDDPCCGSGGMFVQ